MTNGSNQGLYSVIQSPMSTFTENAFSHQSSSVPNILASPVRMAPADKQFGCHETNSLDEMNFSNSQIPSFHPHSFPELHGSLPHGSPCNSSATIGDMTNMGLRMTEGIDGRHFHGGCTNNHVMEHKGGGTFSCFFGHSFIYI